jgi:arginine N-succinyltransferase
METEKLLIRPVTLSDLAAINEIAAAVGPGFNSLPRDSEVIETKIKRSMETFELLSDKKNGLFFFVMEDLKKKLVIGTSMIEVDINHNNPFYSYLSADIVQQSHALKNPINKHNKVLLLVNHYPQASLFAALYLHPEHRGRGRGTFLSRVRPLFVTEFPHLFAPLFVANMQGVFDNNNVSPFWNALGQHFYDLSIHEVNTNYAIYGSQFISDLNPHHPIYIAMLPKEAQEVIGKTHETTKPALHVLEKEGFVARDCIDVFDGGPIIEASKTELKTYRQSQRVKVVGLKEKCEDSNLRMICNTQMDFRATVGAVDFAQGSTQDIFLEKEIASLLKVTVNDPIRICLLH